MPLMAKEATFIQNGDIIDYTAGGTAIAYGEVIPLTTRIGIAQEAIAANATGSVAMTKVFELPAVTGTAFAVGDQLYWDNSANKLTKTDTSNTSAGYATEPKASSAATARVKIG